MAKLIKANISNDDTKQSSNTTAFGKSYLEKKGK